MVSIEDFQQFALAFPESTEEPHFEKTSFRIKKKIFATMDAAAKTSTLKLTEVQQSVFCAWDLTAVSPVPNKWGKQGWTILRLDKVNEEFTRDILKAAYCNVAPKKLAESVDS